MCFKFARCPLPIIQLTRYYPYSSRSPPIATMTMSASPGTAAAASQPDSGGRFHIQKIAIVGAGPSGLAAAKHLVAVGAFAQIDVFEQQAEVGGVWNYSAVPQPAQTLNIPQTDAHGPLDQPVAPSQSSGKGEPPLFPSPMYDDLHTNIPHTLMRYSDLPFPLGEGEEEGEGGGRKNCAIFPSRQVVQEYLVAYSRDVRHLIKFSTQVVDIAPLPPSYPTEENNNASNTTTTNNNNNSDERWAVQTKNLLTYQTATETYDAIVVASGHYATPYVPAVEGLSAFVAAHPGAVSHSKLYRSPEAYRDKKVLVVGNSASGLDIASQIRSVARKPVLVSAQTPAAPEALAHYGGGGGGGGGGIEEVPEIRRFLVEGRGVEFWSGNRRGVTDDGGGEKGVVVVENGDNNGDRSGNGEEGKGNGRTETDIDAIIYCTGYLYTFPFFESLSSPENNNNNNNNPPLVTDGRRVHGLAHHLLHARHPTLAFPGLPQKVIPFPLAEAQMGVVARLWANWLPRPTPAELGRWEQIDEEAWAATARDPRGRKGFHVFGKGEDGRYINAMHDWAMRADGDVTKGEGKKGRGRGRELPHWGEHDFWQRTIYAEAKMRFEKSGKTAKTLEELGFRFEPEKVVAPEKDDEQGLGRVVPTGDDDLDVAG